MLKKKKRLEETEFDAITKFKYLSKIKTKVEKVSSFLTIQEGCDKFCRFCVVPYTRGPEYSRPPGQILDEAKYLADNGVREITLLGQNVNAYESNGFRLSDLILSIEKLNEIKRIRYTTSHPKDMTNDLINVYKSSNKLMPLVHLPVQSGSNKILKLMNRDYSIESYLETFIKLKKINSKIEFSSDFLVAYPGEESQDFEDTLNLIKKVKFINSYSYIFSPRPGTVSENLNLIDKKTSLERLDKIQKELFRNQAQKNKSLENSTVEVLVENFTEDKTKTFGRSKHMTSVIFDGKKSDIGEIVQVKIHKSNKNTLFGEIIDSSNQKVA